MFLNDYQTVFEKIARNAVLEAASKFEASAFWLKRTHIGNVMKAELVKQLNLAHSDVTGFMLLKIDLPNKYEDAIVRTQITNQEKKTYFLFRKVNITT